MLLLCLTETWYYGHQWRGRPTCIYRMAKIFIATYWRHPSKCVLLCHTVWTTFELSNDTISHVCNQSLWGKYQSNSFERTILNIASVEWLDNKTLFPFIPQIHFVSKIKKKPITLNLVLESKQDNQIYNEKNNNRCLVDWIHWNLAETNTT